MTVLYGAQRAGGGFPPAALDAALDAMQRHILADRSDPSANMQRRWLLRSEESAWALTTSGRFHDGVCGGSFVREQGVAVVARSRLDDRAALVNRLEAPARTARTARTPDEGTVSDAALILSAYQRHGIGCVQQISGDWSFALWDSQRQQLVLARDATGVSALYWWQGDGRLLFASSLPVLLAAGPVPRRPDGRWIAGLLTVFSDPTELCATAFERVCALPPGHLLVLQKGHVDVRRWWRPELLEPLASAALPELQQRFLALYDDAVQERLQCADGSVAATLSGGLDSGSVVALAAPALARQGRRLTAYVHTPRFDASATHPGRVSNEWALAQATAQHVGNVRTVACPTLHLSPVEGIRRSLDIVGWPSVAASHWFWLLDIVAQARADGAAVLLTGQGGNSTVSYAGSGSLWPAIRRLRLRHVVRELRGEHRGWEAAVLRRLVKPALRPTWHAGKRAAAACSRRGGVPAWAAYSLLGQGLAHDVGLDEAMARAGHDPSFAAASPQRIATWRLGLSRGAHWTSASWAELGSACGLDVRDPTRDQRIVEFCWRLPDEVFWAHGDQRGLVRSGMRGRLPVEVLDCNRKGLQSSDLRQRLRLCREDLLDEVAAAAAHPVVREWIDVPRLVSSAHAALNADRAFGGVVNPAQMLSALAVAMFLRQHASP